MKILYAILISLCVISGGGYQQKLRMIILTKAMMLIKKTTLQRQLNSFNKLATAEM